ncbi:AraC family transcriptional regulator [Enterococcus rotai]|uniref:AraC family transcriptional regulator n=1 Tax=Enterococcus rotai TaxID=118060 RepID=UPI0032B3AD2A
MAIFLEMPELNPEFPFRIILNDGNILTTPHWHREIELIYVTKGSIHLGINDQPYSLSEGEIVLINGGDIHYVLASPGSERIVFQFDLTFFTGLNTEGLNLTRFFEAVEPLSPKWHREKEAVVREILLEMYHEEQRKEAGFHYQQKADLLKLFVYLFRNIPEKKEIHKSHEKVQSKDILEKLDQVFRYVEQNYTTKITLEEVANSIGYSQFYFTKFFKRNTGKTFITFLNDYRIDKAKWLLINSTDTVSEIISQIGIESDKTFYRLFKQSMEMSPLKYREKMSVKN